MKVIDRLKKAKSTLFSFEILPPLKGKSIQSIYDSIDPLLDFSPSFINVTYHREEYIFKKREGGFLERIPVRKRPGTVGICAAIINKYKIDTVPHLICGGFTKEETENALIDLQFLGIDNVLALRGDAVKSESAFVPEPGGNEHALDLVKQIVLMNHGKYLNEEVEDLSKHSSYCIGVAGYPEKHFECPNMKADLKHLKAKVDAGAEYVVTQLFYNNDKYFEYLESVKQLGIHVPVIPGIKPITSKKQLLSLPKFFHVDIPEGLAEAVEKCENDNEAKEVGIEWTIAQCKELIKHGAPCIHFYTMGRSESVRKIAKAVF
ncbi:MAG: methylenetetrahydrofolate reductase [NAD(P)H] [Bacteroidia bacterium]|nr:methylenetetrahydrofolate reductase [NAD(P)H] [Bacteroidia bacterium]